MTFHAANGGNVSAVFAREYYYLLVAKGSAKTIRMSFFAELSSDPR